MMYLCMFDSECAGWKKEKKLPLAAAFARKAAASWQAK
jgi:hypothetical protein